VQLDAGGGRHLAFGKDAFDLAQPLGGESPRRENAAAVTPELARFLSELDA
jgi:hypothetical protein